MSCLGLRGETDSGKKRRGINGERIVYPDLKK
jgi:hypothetical protein